MSVFVDDLWYRQRGAALSRSCHMMAESRKELDDFAKRIGLKKSWRHADHYDLTQTKRSKAVLSGAIEISTREMVSRFRK